MDSRFSQDALSAAGSTDPVIPDDTVFVGRQDMFRSRTGTETVDGVRMSSPP